jgi:IS30 family transposase
LRQAHKKRQKKYGSKDKHGQICNRVSIDQHPDIVDKKSRIGDWEIDTVIGQNHKGAVVTIVERKSKFTLIKGSRLSTLRV